MRKHRLALIVVGVLHFILFFPTLFMGRVISPNDIFYNYAPWSLLEPGFVQNGLLNDVPTSYLTLMSLLKHNWAAFHWNRFVASGIPGFGSIGAAVLTPFVSLPTLLLPLVLVYSGIVFLKLNVAYFFGYLWLREERMGKVPAALGAAVAGAAGVTAIWWLWPLSNATALYPPLLYLLARLGHGKRIPFAWSVFLAICFALSGFPATVAYGAYLGIAYCCFLFVRQRSLRWHELTKSLGAVLVAALITAPLVIPFARFLMKTGYLESRGPASLAMSYPAAHLAAFVDPYRLGDPIAHSWYGDSRFGVMNNFVETTIFVGYLPLVLSVFAVFRRRRWADGLFWLLTFLIVLSTMFGLDPLARAIGSLPGIRYSPLTRLRFLLPLPVAWLSASGSSWLLSRLRRSPRSERPGVPSLRAVAVPATGVLLAFELAIFAAHFYPYLTPSTATPPPSPTIAFLQAERRPSRIAPYFSYLLPNTSEMFSLEDIRSHFSSEAFYRRMLQRIDPGSWGESGTIVQFNGLRMNARDPFLSMLNVRYMIEPPPIDIVRWSIYAATESGGPDRGGFRLRPGDRLTRQIDASGDDFYAIELVFGVEKVASARSRVELELVRPETGAVLYRRFLAEPDLRVPKVYVPIRPWAADGNSLILHITSHGVTAVMLKTDVREGESQFSFAIVRSPIIIRRELVDGRIFENLSATERYHAVWRSVTLSDDELLARTEIDFRTTAVISGGILPPALPAIESVPPSERRAELRLLRYDPRLDVVQSRSSVPFLLVSSEKLNKELAVSVDGRKVRPVRVNGLFAGVALERGTHTIRFSRKIGREFWGLPAIGLAILLGSVGWELRRSRFGSGVSSRR